MGKGNLIKNTTKKISNLKKLDDAVNLIDRFLDSAEQALHGEEVEIICEARDLITDVKEDLNNVGK